MAGFQLFRKNRIWHYRYRVGGQRTQRSTGEKNRARAEEIAFNAYRRDRIVKEGGGPVPTLAQLARTWLSVHEATASPSHLRAMTTFAGAHLYDLADLRIDRIRTAHVEEARNRHLADHSPASTNHWLRNLKLLFGWAVKRDLLERRPWRVRMQKVQKRPRALLPAEKTAGWLAAVDRVTARRPSIAAAVRLMLGLGLRESEALSARWEWIDWERRTYTPGVTKGREAEALDMPEWLSDYLSSWSPSPAGRRALGGTREGLITPSPSGNRYCAGATRRAIEKANQACGTPGVTPHRLRGTFATQLSEAGVPVQDIQRMLRHKDPVTTLGYLERDSGRSKSALEEIARKTGLHQHFLGTRSAGAAR